MFTCWPFFGGDAEVNRTIQLHLAATHFPECSAQEMRGLEIRWKQNLEKRHKEEEEVTCQSLLWGVCVLRRSISLDFDGYGSPIIQKTVFWVNINLPAMLITREPRYQGFDKRRCVNCLEVNHAKSWLVWFGFLADKSPAESDFTELQDRACLSDMLFDIVWHWLGNSLSIYIYI